MERCPPLAALASGPCILIPAWDNQTKRLSIYAAPFCCPLSDGLLTLFLCLPYSCFRQITFGRGRRWKPRRRDSP